MSKEAEHAEIAHLVRTDGETLDVLGPTVQVLTEPAADEGPCLMLGTIPPGAFVPLHSHADPETFVHIAGELECLSQSGDEMRWMRINPGDIFHVPREAKHAFRNLTRVPAVSIIVSTGKIARFFREIGQPVRDGHETPEPSQTRLEQFRQAAERYGYWSASPEENARAGLVLPSVL